MRFIALVILGLIEARSLLASDLKFRARESYEVVYVEDAQANSATYGGLSNTINYFYEKPLEYSYGLAFGSIFSAFKTKDELPEQLSKELQVYFIGLEGKYFLFDQGSPSHTFIRGGGYYSKIIPQGKYQAIDGALFYAGAGHEFFVADKVTLCPEFGLKVGRFSGLENYQSQVFSLALHFYTL